MSKKQLSITDMTRISGFDKSYIEDCILFKVIPAFAYTETEVPYGGKTKEEEKERHEKIVRAKNEGKPWKIETRVKTAEEVFKSWLSLPRGRDRLLDYRTRQLIENLKNGLPEYYVGETKEKMKKSGEALD